MSSRGRFTHFLSLQLSSAQLKPSLAAFRADVTRPPPDGLSLPDTSIRPPGTMHITLGVMNLGEDSARRQATSLLGGLQPQRVLAEVRARERSSMQNSNTDDDDDDDNSGLKISVRGLQAMGSPSSTSVLYAVPMDAQNSLYSFCQELRKPFCEAGLVGDGRPLKLHMTVMNTIYARGGGKPRRSAWKVDATEVLRRYDGFSWAEDMPVTRLALCRMGARNVEGGDWDENQAFGV
ncbi:hypothetical protein E4U55_002022 [Claviceps digitariae]|nr:hypothetical protein E4U55_002022 [Claviceps digitariae]